MLCLVNRHEDVHWNPLHCTGSANEAVMLVKEPKKTMKMLEGHVAM